MTPPKPTNGDGTPSQTVLITVDALRADHLAQYGYHRDTMPALDRLTDDGVRYDRAFANGAHTQLSIPSILTSRLDGLGAAKQGPTVATVLRDAGVSTAGFHSNSVVSRDFPSVHGFDEWYDFSDHATGSDERSNDQSGLAERVSDTAAAAAQTVLKRLRPYLGDKEWAVKLRRAVVPDSVVHEPTPYADAEFVTDRVVEWVSDHADDPFFAWVHYMDPHRPYGYSLSDAAYVDAVPPRGEIDRLMAKAGVSPDAVTEAEREHIVDLYDSDLRYLNAHLDRLFDELQSLGIWESGSVLLTADHGEEFGEHGSFYHRNKPYDELVHVPLIESPPGNAGRSVVDGQRELLDVGPTVLQRHGVDIPDAFEGRPLDAGDDRTVVAAAVRNDRLMLGVRANGFKYVTTEHGDEELYDLSTDPAERTDVVAENEAQATSLRAAIPDGAFDIRTSVEQLDELGETDEKAKHRLEALGYLE